ncbi:DUF6134 family protein [Persicobacter psychrovividus]|uniref:Uncharacterized protein n=1 Tax=Persicobacter psychrovividus TaxID=387638 RepID=A0ABM7VDZ7_9BACT|nr:hypothetical protein PEPS_14160 [Persicobacter psychrovividus]
MNSVKTYMLLLLLMINGVQFATAQLLMFDIFIGGKVVGEMQVEKKLQGSLEQYSMKSSMEVNLFKKMINEFTINVEYINGKLTYSYFENYLNQDLKEKTIIQTKQGKLSVTKEDDHYFIGEVPFSIIRAYFEKPTGQKVLFSERLGEFLDLKKESENAYKLKVGMMKESHFYYQDNKCVKVEGKFGPTSFTFLRQK